MKTIQIIQYTQQNDSGYGEIPKLLDFYQVINMDTEIEYEEDGDFQYVDAIRVQDKDDNRFKVQKDDETLYNLITITF